MAYRLTAQARGDLVDIWAYVASNNELAADHFINKLTRHFQLLAEMPYMGHNREEFHKNYRSFLVGNYLIFYRIHIKDIHIMRILHSSRDIKKQLFNIQ